MMDEKVIYSCTAILPESGMETELFLACLEEDCRKTVRKMIKEGVLKQVVVAGKNRVLPSSGEGEIEEVGVKAFLNRLYEKGFQTDGYTFERYGQICNTFQRATGILLDTTGEIAQMGGELYRQRGDLDNCLLLFQRFLWKQEKLSSQNPVKLAEALFEMGSYDLYRWFRHGEEELYLKSGLARIEDAQNLMEEHLEPEDFRLAHVRMTLAFVYRESGSFSEAEALMDETLGKQQRLLGSNHPDVALTHLEYANMYYHWTERKKRLAHTEKAIEILEAQSGIHPKLWDAYLTMEGCFYASQYQERMEMMKKVLSLLDTTAPWRIKTYYLCYNHMDFLARQAGDHLGRIKPLRKMLTLLEMLPQKEHPEISERISEIENVLAELTAHNND